MSIFIPLLALSIVVFIHELGHLLVARASRIGVSHFALGFGPVLVQFTWKKITYSIRALPFGGFVRIKGLDSDEAFTYQPESLSFYDASLFKRILTLASGSLANIFLGFCLFVTIFVSLGHQEAKPIVEAILPNSPALKAGLRPGDKIMAVDGHIVKSPEEIISKVSLGHPINVTYLRNSKASFVMVTPTAIEGEKSPRVGIRFQVVRTPLSVKDALKRGSLATWISIKEVGIGLKMLFTGQVKVKDMSGPIGIMQVASFGLGLGILQFFGIIAKISISLGVLNLMPFPILDGGHIAIQCLEKGLRRRISPRIERLITLVGMAILLSLMVLIAVNDIVSWDNRGELLESLKK